MITYDDEKMTANQCAKQIIDDALDRASFWDESLSIDRNSLTCKDRQAIRDQLEKRIAGVRKYLGL